MVYPVFAAPNLKFGDTTQLWTIVIFLLLVFLAVCAAPFLEDSVVVALVPAGAGNAAIESLHVLSAR